MKRTQAPQRHLISVTASVLGVLLAPPEVNAVEVTVARYSTVQPAPSLAQRDPLPRWWSPSLVIGLRRFQLNQSEATAPLNKSEIC